MAGLALGLDEAGVLLPNTDPCMCIEISAWQNNGKISLALCEIRCISHILLLWYGAVLLFGEKIDVARGEGHKGSKAWSFGSLLAGKGSSKKAHHSTTDSFE